MIVAQQPTEPRPTSDDTLSGIGVRRAGFDELVAEPLMVPLVMVVFDVLGEQMPKMPLSERNHAIEAFGLHG